MTTPTLDEAPPRNTSRLERRKARTRAAILESAARLFCENGFEETSIAQIAESADSGVGTLYGYFANKEEILREVPHGHGEDATAAFLANVSEEMPAIDKLCLALNQFAAYVRDNHTLLVSAFIVDTRTRDPQPEEGAASRLARGFTALIKEGIQRGELRPVPPETTARSLVSIYSMAFMGIAQWKGRYRDPDTARELEAMVRSMLKA